MNKVHDNEFMTSMSSLHLNVVDDVVSHRKLRKILQLPGITRQKFIHS